MNKTSTRFMRGSLLLVMLLILSACVTDKGRVFTNEASPNDAMITRVQLARSYIGEQDWENAKRNLKIAVEIDPNSPEVHEAFALVYQSTGENELAEESFKKAIALRSRFSRARNNYAAFLYAGGRYREAQEQLEVVIQDTLYEQRPQAFVNLGLCRVQLGDLEGAKVAFTRALTMDRNNLLAIMEMANVEVGLHNWREAQRYLIAFHSLTKRQSPRVLWLGIRVAHELNDADGQASKSLALRNMFPNSAEYQAYEQALRSGEL
jgi:type IV pilus assembly protein PilF